MSVVYPDTESYEIHRFFALRSPLRIRRSNFEEGMRGAVRLEMGLDTNTTNLYTNIRTAVEQGRAEEENLRTNYSELSRSIVGRINSGDIISSNEVEDQRRIFEQILSNNRQRAWNIRKLAKGFISSNNFVSSAKKLQIDVSQFSKWISSNKDEILSIESLDNKINELFETRSQELVRTPKFQNDMVNLTNTIIAFHFQNVDISNEEEVVEAFRIFSLIKRISDKDAELTKDVIGKAINVAILMPRDLFYRPDPVPEPSLRKISPTDPRHQIIKKRLKLKKLSLAYDEFENLSSKDIVAAAAGGAAGGVAGDGSAAGAADDGGPMITGSTRLILRPNAVAALRQETLEMIAEAGYNLDDVPVDRMAEYLESQIDSTSQMIAMTEANSIRMDSIILIDNDVYEVIPASTRRRSPMGPSVLAEGDIPLPPSGTGFKFLIGELNIIKERISKYVPEEISHVENVLQGEHKERTHRRLDRTEETLVTEEEIQEETINELETTDRFEMQKTIEENTQEMLNITAGVDVTVRYGKAVEANTTFDLGYEQVLNEAKSSSSNYSRETIQKATQKINKKTREKRTLRIIKEMEEINKHGIVGPNQHVRGIYQWLTKYYCAKLINYGKRLMIEFMVPEPGKLIRYIKTKKPINIGMDEPKDPRFRNGEEDYPIKDPSFINFTNYLKLAADYEVEVNTYPKLYTFISKSFTQEGGDSQEHDFFKSEEIPLTPGYQATFVICSIMHQDMPSRLYDLLELGPDVPSGDLDQVNANMDPDDQRFVKGVRVRLAPFVEFSSIRADYPFDPVRVWAKKIDWNYDNIVADPTKYLPTDVLPVSISGRMVKGYSTYIYIVQKRTRTRTTDWRIEVFNKIMDGYYKMKSRYDQLKSEATYEQQKTQGTFGSNPERNKEIIKNELKKYAIMLLTKRDDGSPWNLINPLSSDFDPPDVLPELNVTLAKWQGQEIKFFEQAMEWENMTYLFYSYFWGTRSEWADTSVLEDADPLYEKFLKAGYARVIVPIRPNFEPPFIYFLSTGSMPYLGGDVYYPTNPLYVSIITEIKEQQGIIDENEDVIEEWEYRVPTSLLYLKETGSLPEFEACVQENGEQPVVPEG